MRTVEYVFLTVLVVLTVSIAACMAVGPIANAFADSTNTFEMIR